VAKGAGATVSLESYGATVLRIALGIIFVMHAYFALFQIGPRAAVALQRSLGLPVPEIGAWYLIFAHGLGGILLILGVLTRWAALANLPIMAAAFFLVHLRHGFFIGRGDGYEYVMLVLAATLAQVFLGPGALALRR
jgi:putative oxidoreductase